MNQFEIGQDDINLVELISKIVNLLHPLAAEKKLEFSYRVEQNVPSQVSLDSARLEQVLINLLSNSFRFTDYGYVKLLIKQHTELKNVIIF